MYFKNLLKYLHHLAKIQFPRPEEMFNDNHDLVHN